MSDDATESSRPTEPGVAGRRPLAGRLRRLVVKELREILRDRRTIITLVVMPILIYPLLAVVFQRFLVTSIPVEAEVEYIIGVDSEPAAALLAEQMQQGERSLEQHREADAGPASTGNSSTPRLNPYGAGGEPNASFIALEADELERHVIDSSLHVAVLANRNLKEHPKAGLRVPMKWDLVYRVGSPTSEAALHFVESRLQAYNESQLDRQLVRLGVVAALPAATTRHPISFSGAPIFSLAALIPLILVLMTVTGAVYPAIDLTAGERERGTLETLTALVNLAGMTITAHSTGLAATLFGGGMSFDVVVKVLLLLALFAAFFSAILLALTSCARSFKEAQAYIIPLMLLCLVPGVLCLMPGLRFKGWMAVTPLVNIVMLARDLLEGSVVTSLAVAAVCSTILYVAAAIALAARIFGTDAILYGSQATWSDLVRRPPEPKTVAALPAALLALALMFSFYFVLGTGLARSSEMTMGGRLAVTALITAAVFGGIPLALATFGRLQWSSGLGLRWPGWLSLLAAAVLGVSLWPAAHELFLVSERLGMSALGQEQIALAKQMIRGLSGQPLWLVLVALALVPGVFEDLSFRGLLYSSLRRVMAGGWAVVISALVFGVFHEVLFPGRLLTSTFLGLVLGWVRLRTGSVVPCMVLHVVHNGLLLTVSHQRDAPLLSRWDIEEQTHLPAMWLALAAVGVLVGTGLILMANRVAQTRSAE